MVELTVPRLRKLPRETAIIERYKRRESSVEQALIEMYLAGVSLRRVEDITEAVWGTRVSASAVSGMAQKVYGQIEAWRSRRLHGEHAYVYLDGTWKKRSWGGEVKNVAVLIAIGLDQEGYREVLGVAEGAKEDAESWRNFLRHLKERGLSGVKLFITDIHTRPNPSSRTVGSSLDSSTPENSTTIASVLRGMCCVDDVLQDAGHSMLFFTTPA